VGWKIYMENKFNEIRNDSLNQAVIEMVIESWRFSKVFERMIAKLDVSERGKYLSQYKWFIKKVESSLAGAGMHIVNVEGQLFDAGMAASPLNLDEFDDNDCLIVDNMLEPIIMGHEGLVKTGTVTLKKVSL
jgi:hypothetical protein